MIDSARAAGLDVAATMYPYAASGNGLSAECLPAWVFEGGNLLARLREGLAVVVYLVSAALFALVTVLSGVMSLSYSATLKASLLSGV